jgi:glutathione S-transferase
MLTLYTNPMSRGRIARWMLEEVGQPYAVELLGYGKGGPDDMKGPDFLAVNPMGKVPTLVHDGVTVTETAAICAYLADAFPEAKLAPAAHERGAYYRWLFFAAGPIEAAATNKALGFELPPGKERTAGYGDFDTLLATIEQAVTGRAFVAGDRFTAADVYFGSQIGWGMMFGTIPKTPALEAYWQGLSGRPAYVRAGALDDAAMPPKQG